MLSVTLSGLHKGLPHKTLERKKKYRRITVLIDGPNLFRETLFNNYVHLPKRPLQRFEDICDNQNLPRFKIIVPQKPEFYTF